MNPTILPNTDPNLRLIVAIWDRASQHAYVETRPIIAWWVVPYRQPEPICLNSLRDTDWGLEDRRTGCVEIPDDGIYDEREDAILTLMGLARSRFELEQLTAAKTAKEL